MATSGQGRIERRLAAILAADVAGYSRLMGGDEAGTARALREHRAAVDPIVAHYGGRIVKTTAMACSWSFPRSWPRSSARWRARCHGFLPSEIDGQSGWVATIHTSRWGC